MESTPLALQPNQARRTGSDEATSQSDSRAPTNGHAALFALPTAQEVAQRLAALEALGQDVPNRRAEAGLGPLNLAGGRAEGYGYTAREDAQR